MTYTDEDINKIIQNIAFLSKTMSSLFESIKILKERIELLERKSI